MTVELSRSINSQQAHSDKEIPTPATLVVRVLVLSLKIEYAIAASCFLLTSLTRLLEQVNLVKWVDFDLSSSKIRFYPYRIEIRLVRAAG